VRVGNRQGRQVRVAPGGQPARGLGRPAGRLVPRHVPDSEQVLPARRAGHGLPRRRLGEILGESERRRVLAIALCILLPAAAVAQDYPTKPIIIIVPAAAGGPTDTLTRVLAQAMGDALKQQMIIENVGGAGGTLRITRAAKARPDVYTLLLYHIGMATSPALYRKL